MSKLLAALTGLVVALGLLVAPASATDGRGSGDDTSFRAAGTTTQASAERGSRRSTFTPRRGPTFNSPLGSSASRRAIFDKVLRSIYGTPKGQEIKIFSWNFLTREGTDALLNAQRRGVRVRLLMDSGNNDPKVANGPYRRLRAGLAAGNKGRPKDRNSWARTCRGSCRGPGGSAHSKFFMFSRVGQAKQVVIQGSANFTVASTNNQWNDVYTHRDNQKVWNFYSKTFREAIADEPAQPAYISEDLSTVKLVMFPSVGKAGRDPVMQLLQRVRCQGATNTGTGRTRIRIAPDVIRQDRGMRLATRVRQLWDNGCDIRIGYTVMGIDIGRMLRAGGPRGPVPMRHFVQDVDADGEFDNYFHLKAMSVVGHIGKQRGAYSLLNGSANWSGTSRVSDENIGVYRTKAVTLRYQEHIDYWWNRFGSGSARVLPRTAGGQPVGGGDQLVFGTGPDAVYADGTPYSTTGQDPFASNDELES